MKGKIEKDWYFADDKYQFPKRLRIQMFNKRGNFKLERLALWNMN
nr:hypothetical protein [Mycoplasmopsis bovis]